MIFRPHIEFRVKNGTLYSVNVHGEIHVMDNKAGDGLYIGRKLRQYNNGNGYKYVHLCGSKEYVHRVVAEAFIPNPHDKKCVNHIDHVKDNNHVDNLEWATHSENTNHSKDNTDFAKGERSHKAKLTEKDVLAMRRMYETGEYTTRELAPIFKVGKSAVHSIVSRKTWTHI